MLDVGGVLQTYRLELPPGQLLGRSTEATKIFDHPLKFLTYEGSVNKGLGSVQIADSGTYQLLGETGELLQMEMKGEILRGRFSLAHTDDDRWEFKERTEA